MPYSGASYKAENAEIAYGQYLQQDIKSIECLDRKIQEVTPNEEISSAIIGCNFCNILCI